MTDIQFVKSDDTIDPKLFSDEAEAMAITVKKDYEASKERQNRRSQIRKFYDEIIRLESIVENRPESWSVVLPQIHMLIAKAAYAQGRGLVSMTFLNFIRNSVKQVDTPRKLRIFSNFFEAFMGFYKFHCPKSN